MESKLLPTSNGEYAVFPRLASLDPKDMLWHKKAEYYWDHFGRFLSPEDRKEFCDLAIKIPWHKTEGTHPILSKARYKPSWANFILLRLNVDFGEHSQWCERVIGQEFAKKYSADELTSPVPPYEALSQMGQEELASWREQWQKIMEETRISSDPGPDRTSADGHQGTKVGFITAGHTQGPQPTTPQTYTHTPSPKITNPVWEGHGRWIPTGPARWPGRRGTRYPHHRAQRPTARPRNRPHEVYRSESSRETSAARALLFGNSNKAGQGTSFSGRSHSAPRSHRPCASKEEGSSKKRSLDEFTTQPSRGGDSSPLPIRAGSAEPSPRASRPSIVIYISDDDEADETGASAETTLTDAMARSSLARSTGEEGNPGSGVDPSASAVARPRKRKKEGSGERPKSKKSSADRETRKAKRGHLHRSGSGGQSKTITEQATRIADQDAKITEQAARLGELEKVVKGLLERSDDSKAADAETENLMKQRCRIE